MASVTRTGRHGEKKEDLVSVTLKQESGGAKRELPSSVKETEFRRL